MNRKRLIFYGVLLLVSVLFVLDVSGRTHWLPGPGPIIRIDEVLRGVQYDYSRPPAEATVAVSGSGSLDIPAGNVGKLALQNSRGSIRVSGSDGESDRIVVNYELTAYGLDEDVVDEQQVKAYVESLSLVKQVADAVLGLEMVPADPSLAVLDSILLQVDYELTVPSQVFVDLENSYGVIALKDFENGAAVRAEYNNSLRIENVSGALDISAHHTPVRIEQVQGDVRLTSSHSSVELEDIAGQLALESRHCTLRVHRIQGGVQVKLSHDQVYLQSVSGSLSGQTSHAIVVGSGIEGGVDLDSSFGALELTGLAREVWIKSRYTPVRLVLDSHEAGYRFTLATHSGSIHTSLPLEEEEVERDQIVRTGQIGRGHYAIDIFAEHAPIRVAVQ